MECHSTWRITVCCMIHTRQNNTTCMVLCMYLHCIICTHIQTHTNTHIHTHAQVQMHTHTHARTHKQPHTCMYAQTHSFECMSFASKYTYTPDHVYKSCSSLFYLHIHTCYNSEIMSSCRSNHVIILVLHSTGVFSIIDRRPDHIHHQNIVYLIHL